MTIPTSQLIAAIESTIIRMPTRPGVWGLLTLLPANRLAD